MMNAARRVRSKSPFRRSRSKSPFGNNRRTLSPFARRGRSQSEAMDEAEGGLHESEINIFQQLCLDRHDDSAAIEILLEESPEKELLKPEVPDLYTASSESSDPSSRAHSRETMRSRGTNATRASAIERKRPFFKRLFKSPRKHGTADELTKFPSTPCQSLPESQASGPSDEMNYVPKPPSGVPKARQSMPLGLPPPAPVTSRVLSDKFDTFSNMSSISGSHMTGRHKAPVHLDRQESLGTDSIKDIRKALKEMEKQLGKATNKGERVSRQKVMRALFTVADSLEDIDEREVLRSELEGMMRIERASHTTDNRPLSVTSSDDEKSDMTTSDDDEDHTASQAPGSQPSAAPTGLFTSVGRMFGMSNDEKVAVEQALDDLLWTEFVATRRATNANSKENQAPKGVAKKPGSHNQQKVKARKSRPKRGDTGGDPSQVAADRRRETLGRPFDVDPYHDVRRTPLGQSHGDANHPIYRPRSWWRTNPASRKSSIRGESDEDDDDEEEFDNESYSSDEFPNYLPTSITVRQGNGNRRNNSRRSMASSSNPRYKVKLVDTESRYGYEMGSTISSRR